MKDGWMQDKEARRWARRVLADLVPMIQDSAITVSLVPRGETDIKFAVELGLSIMLDKPILLVVAPGTQVPAKLVQIAEDIVEVDLGAPGAQERVGEAIERMIGRRPE